MITHFLPLTDLFVVDRDRIGKSAPSGASGATNSARHGEWPFKPLRLLKCHGECLQMKLFLTHLQMMLPLWSPHPLAPRSNISRLLLRHAYQSITHLPFSNKDSIFLPSSLFCSTEISFLLLSLSDFFCFSWLEEELLSKRSCLLGL